MKRVFIAGYYGYDNFGDEHLFKSVIKLLKEIDNDIKIVSLYKSRQSDQEISSFNKYNFFKLIKAIKDSDLVIFGGGNLLQNETSNRNLLFFSSIIYLAKIFKKKVVFISQGLGPAKGWGRWILSRTLKNKNIYGIFRDYTSYLIISF